MGNPQIHESSTINSEKSKKNQERNFKISWETKIKMHTKTRNIAKTVIRKIYSDKYLH